MVQQDGEIGSKVMDGFARQRSSVNSLGLRDWTRLGRAE
jgi:hypothetical protein